MSKHQSSLSKKGFWIVGFILGTSLLVWGLTALSGHGNTTSSSTSQGGDGSGAAIYLQPSPVVTAALSTPGKRTVVWFSATWCGICKSMSPYVQKVIERHADSLLITERDVDREPGLDQQYAVRGTPTFVLLDDRGQLIDKRSGYQSEPQFEAFVTQAL